MVGMILIGILVILNPQVLHNFVNHLANQVIGPVVEPLLIMAISIWAIGWLFKKGLSTFGLGGGGGKKKR